MARQFLKLTSDWDEDERIAMLPDLAQLLFVKTLSRAKRQRPGGSFGSAAHLKALLPDRLHRHLPALFQAGLLAEEQGRVVVVNWSRYQVDPTTAERSARFRATHTQRSRDGEVTGETQRETRDTRLETRDLTKKVSTRNGKPESAYEIILGRGR